MLALLASSISSIFQGWVKVKVSKQEAQAAQAHQEREIEGDWDTVALKASQTSWKDEFITLIIYSPLIVAWFDQEAAMKWVQFVKELPVFYQVFMAGILCASFGLRWFFKQQALNIAKGTHLGDSNIGN